MRNTRTILLSRHDIERALDMTTAIDVIESVLRAHGERNVLVPPKLSLDMSLLGMPISAAAMPAYVPGENLYGLKWVCTAPENPGHDLPLILGTLLLNDPSNGILLAILDGSALTALRTGAVAGVAARCLAKEGAAIAAFVGCGAQARSSLLALHSVLDLRKVFAVDVRPVAAQSLATEATEQGLAAYAVTDIQVAVKAADVVVVATTANRPLIFREWVHPGTLIIKLGSHQELEDELTLGSDRLIVDQRAQAEQRGELAHLFATGHITQSKIDAELGEIIAGREPGRTNEREIIIAALIGMGAEDIAIGGAIYRRAQELQLGTSFDFLA